MEIYTTTNPKILIKKIYLQKEKTLIYNFLTLRTLIKERSEK
jgi:hypothetical protein